MRPAEMDKLREPLCPEPDVRSSSFSQNYNNFYNDCATSQVQILLPSLVKLRTVVERLRAHSDIIALRANNAGQLQICASTEVVRLNVTWNGLKNPPIR